MKKQIVNVLVIGILACMLVGCGNQQGVSNTSIEQQSTTDITTLADSDSAQTEETAGIEAEMSTEAPHEHFYTETITMEATCEAEGVKTFACECGDTYTEAIEATGHIYENYVYNGDATYLADGTETSTCSSCEQSDTRAAAGTKMEYTYTDLDKTLYASGTVNVRNLPSTDGEKVGSLKTSQEVKVTGQCVETKWYRIEFDGATGYVSSSYLTADKPLDRSSLPSCPYQLLTLYDNGGKEITYYYIYNGSYDYVPPLNQAKDILYQRGYSKTGTDDAGRVYTTACVAWDYVYHEYAEGTVIQCNVFYGEFLNSITGLPTFNGEGVMVPTRY